MATATGDVPGPWGCSRCGTDRNFATRASCRICGADAPRKIQTYAAKVKADGGRRGKAKMAGEPRKGWADPVPKASLLKELAAVKKDLEALRAERGASSKASATSGSDTSMGSDLDEDKAELAAAHAEIAALRKLDARLHEHIAGGYQMALDTAVAKRDRLLAKRRGDLPLETQLSKAQAYVLATAKKLAWEEGKRNDLAKEQTELAKRMVAQDAMVAAAEDKVRTAKEELAFLSSRLAEAHGRPGFTGSVPLSRESDTKQALADLVAFVSDVNVQNTLVAAGLPPGQQARVHAALQAVQAAAMANADMSPGAPRQSFPQGALGVVAAGDDDDMLGDEEALSLAEELCGPGLQTESLSDHAARVLAAKLKVQQMCRSRKGGKVKK